MRAKFNFPAVVIAFLIAMTGFSNAIAQRPYYGDEHHTHSHGGHYSGGRGSSHRGGQYRNARTRFLLFENID